MSEDKSLNCRMTLQSMDYQGTKRLLADIACVAPDFALWASDLMGRDLTCGLKVQAAWEQEPLEANRIALSDEADRLGVPRAKLLWKKSIYDVQTAKAAVSRFGEYLAQSGNGRLRVAQWVLDEGPFPGNDPKSGNHHMGGTRMAATANDGIVDSNCKVFGQANLFIAGSSVFPSGGHANPTFTIVQLVSRLGDHLAKRGPT